MTCPGWKIHFVDDYGQTQASSTKLLSIRVQDFEYADLVKIWIKGAHRFQEAALTFHARVRRITKPQHSNARRWDKQSFGESGI